MYKFLYKPSKRKKKTEDMQWHLSPRVANYGKKI